MSVIINNRMKSMILIIYAIAKGRGEEIKVESKEGEIILQLPGV